MKKILLILMLLLAGMLLNSGFAPTAHAFPDLDQECSLAGTDYDLISSVTTPREQSFVPSSNRLEIVNMWWNGDGFAGDQSIKTSILNSSREVIGSQLGDPTFEVDGPLIRNAEFNPPLVLTPGQIYYIQVDVLDGPHNLYWYRSIGDCYNKGSAFGEGSPMSWDFLFQTYGTAYTPPAPSTPVTTTTTAPSTASTTTPPAATSTTKTSTPAPQTTTSASIAVPANLLIAYDDINKAAFLSWKASATVDIDGYVISRSEDGTTYKDLGALSKDTLSYSDKDVTAGKTYYYQVKAYKGTLASLPTAAVMVSIPEQAAAATADIAPVATKEVGFFTTLNILLLSGGLLVLILAGLFIYLRKKRAIAIKNPLKPAQS